LVVESASHLEGREQVQLGRRRSGMKREDLMIKEGTGLLSEAEEMILIVPQTRVRCRVGVVEEEVV
jgi:hypothetical protein